MTTLLVLAAAASAQEVPPIPHDCLPMDRATVRPPHAGWSTLASARHPIVVWYDPAHPNSVDIADDVLAIVEQSWDVQVDQLGFRPPVLPDLGDGPEFDVFLADYQPLAAFVTNDDWTDDVVGDGYNGTSSFMVVDHELPLAAVPSFLSHEFNHACQYATDFSELTLPIWEAVATAAQDWTVGAESYWDYDVYSFQEAPFAPVLEGDSYALYYTVGLGYTYEYGAAFWVMWLDEKLGNDDGVMGAALWEAAANEGIGMEPDVVDAFAEVAGMTVGDALDDFAVVRFLTGDDWDERGLADAASWGPLYHVPAFPLTGADVVGDHVPVPPPLVHGQLFWDVDLVAQPLPEQPADTERTLVFSAASASGLESGLAVLWWDDAGQAGDLAITGTSPVLELPAEGLTRVVVALTNLGPNGWDGDDDAYQPGDQVVTVAIDDEPLGGGTTTPPGTTPPGTDTTDDDPPGEEGDGGGAEEKGGCGCSGVGTAPWLLGPLALAITRRRRR
jgi:hypothetical protein